LIFERTLKNHAIELKQSNVDRNSLWFNQIQTNFNKQSSSKSHPNELSAWFTTIQLPNKIQRPNLPTRKINFWFQIYLHTSSFPILISNKCIQISYLRKSRLDKRNFSTASLIFPLN
jgi:hypothetical protein